MGENEKNIIDKLSNAVNKVIQDERKYREYFIRKERLKIEDEVYKSYGILRYSRKMSLSDGMLLLSKLRLGIVSGIIRMTDEQLFMTCQMFIGIQPANLRMLSGSHVSEKELDEFRAIFIRENIPTLN